MEQDILNNYIVNDSLQLEKIVKNYSGYIYMIVKNMTNDILKDEDIEEIISDVLLVVWKNKDQIEWFAPLKPYIAGVTKNITKNALRKQKIDCEIIEETLKSNEDIDEYIEQKEELDIIEKELDSFGKDSRIFIMFYYNGMKAKDIGKQLGMTESNVNVKLHRMKEKIKKELKKRGYNYGK